NTLYARCRNLFSGTDIVKPGDLVLSSWKKGGDVIVTTRNHQSSIRFSTTPDENTGIDYERMTIRESGSIGVNTNNPIGTFDIIPKNSWFSKPRISFSTDRTNDGNPSIRFYRPTGNTSLPDLVPSYVWWIETTCGTDVWNANAAGAMNFMASTNGLSTDVTPGDDRALPNQPPNMFTRMTIRNNGNVGVNYELPISKLHVHDGSILFDGIVGSTPKKHKAYPGLPTDGDGALQEELGEGTRFMWIPGKGALRAGRISSTLYNALYVIGNHYGIDVKNYWDDENIGFFSAAFGVNNLVQGPSSVAIGVVNTIHSTFIGSLNNAGVPTNSSGSCSLIVGSYNNIDGHNSLGYSTARSCFIAGSSNEITVIDPNTLPNSSFILGDGCHVHGYASGAFGYFNHTNQDASFAMGHHVECFEENTMGLGQHLVLNANSTIGIGQVLTTSAVNSIVIGGGFLYQQGGNFYPLDNNIPNSLMIGFKSQTPTLFVGGSDFDGNYQNATEADRNKFGKVGIGTKTPPNYLTVKGNASIGANYSGSQAPTDGLIVEGNVCIGTTTEITYNNGQKAKLSVNGVAMRSDGYTSWGVTSDRRLKRDIRVFSDGLDKIDSIKPVWYKYTGECGTDTTEEKIGIIAQEIKEVAPYTVKEATYIQRRITTPEVTESYVLRVDTITSKLGEVRYDTIFTSRTIPAKIDTQKTNVLTYNSHAITYILINAVKELHGLYNTVQSETKTTIDSLTHSNLELQKRIVALEERVNRLESKISISQDSTDDVILDQNRPNPFSEETTIFYYIPPRYSTNVSLILTDINNSNTIQTYQLKTDEPGQIKINAGMLNKGVYLYSIVANSMILKSKKMMVIH
ncbi:MAG: tail fiber domain-containing protein, partial [Candidatus Kapabacteria bacterium]|nr:tail fiber domain-containing protein [Candidatus Kapabacteria bacterium]